jgi:hypothetical protein
LRNRLHLLETRPAQHGPALRGTKWNRRLLAASRASGTRFCTHARSPVRTLRFTLLAALGVVFKLFIVKKELLTRGEHKFIAAIYALQDSIGKFHGRLPREGKKNRPDAPRARSRFPVLVPRSTTRARAA